MTPDEMKKRTKQFALRTIKLCDSLPNRRAANVIANQLIRSATSVGANYRSACRARSQADFVSKVGITLEESDESVYWMELIVDSNMKPENQVADLMKEGNELTAIFNASFYTARENTKKSQRPNQKSTFKNQK
jgi:four helix bundle protein